MAEIKNTFLKGKMNKDLDARLLPNGEYRDAQNLQISRSEGSTVGEFENILGDLAVASTGSESVKVIGYFTDTTNNIIYYFASSFYNIDSTARAASTDTCKIFSYNIDTNQNVELVTGYWLNLNNAFPINSVNLVEELLFFTDNLNQPRKINISLANPNGIATPTYYFNEDQVSVAKYYPYETILVFDRFNSRVDGAVNNSNIVVLGDSADTIQVGDIVNDWDRDFGTTIQITTLITVIEITANKTVKLSEAVTLPDAFHIQFTRPTMTNKSSLEVSNFTLVETYAVAGTTAGSNITITSSLLSNTPVLGMYVTCPSNPVGFSSSSFGATPINTGVITSVVISGADTIITVDVANTLTALTLPDILIGANPSYDSSWKGDPDYLKEEYVRFSYRLRFVDGEYSLMAPFTQIMFIPQQYGEFGKGTATQNEDMEEAYKSTIIAWMQNNVDNIVLRIPIPKTIKTGGTMVSTNVAVKLIDNLHVESIDILYKESNSLAVKVLDSVNITTSTPFTSISFRDLINGDQTNYYYNYNYESSKPYKTLPQNQTVRVYDKVPVKALAQEIIGNRVVYGNYQDKHSSPLAINYSATTADKSVTYDNYGQFPNSSLKENRTYQVGVVLSDRYGRQSTVVLSTQDDIPNSAGSSIYSPYKNYGNNNVFSWLGDALRVTFNEAIPVDNPGPGQHDVINKPLGWFSYKIVVKQTEQDYYNVYLPGFVNGYPVIEDVEQDVTAFTILIGDNINKVPRDLSEVSGQQTQFNSSTRLFGRVNNPDINNKQVGAPVYPYTDHQVPYNQQYYPGIKSDFVRNIATTQDGEVQTSPFQAGIAAAAFSNADGKIPWGTTPGNTDDNMAPLYNGDSNPYYAELSVGQRIVVTNNDNPVLASRNRSNQLGAICTATAAGGTGGIITMQPFLTVSETEPTTSLLDIFWESSTSGNLNTLNTSINAQYDGLVTTTDTNLTFLETLVAGGAIDLQFSFVDGGGTERTNLNSAVITSITDNSGNAVDVRTFELRLNTGGNAGTYGLYTGTVATTGLAATFWYGTSSPQVNNYTITFTTNYTDPGGEVFNNTISTMNVLLQNSTPGTLSGTQCPITLTGVDAPSVNDTIIFNYLTGETVGSTANYGKMDNGSVDVTNLQSELTFAIQTQVDTSGAVSIFEFANTTDGILRVKSSSTMVSGETYTILVDVTDNNGDISGTAPYTGITYSCSLQFTVGAQHINRAPCNGIVSIQPNTGCGNYRQIWAFVNSLSQTGNAGGFNNYPQTGISGIIYGTSNNYTYYNVAAKYSNTIIGSTSSGGLNSGASIFIEPTLRFTPNTSNNPNGNVYYTIQYRATSGASWSQAVYYQFSNNGGATVVGTGTMGVANYLNGEYLGGGATDYKTKFWFNVAGEYRVLTSYVQGAICSTSDSDKVRFFPDFGDGNYTGQCSLGPL